MQSLTEMKSIYFFTWLVTFKLSINQNSTKKKISHNLYGFKICLHVSCLLLFAVFGKTCLGFKAFSNNNKILCGF